MLGLKQVHHIAIIATDYAASKTFYCDVLGFTLLSEAYREERDSWKGDLALNGRRTTLNASRFALTRLRINVLPFSTTQTDCRSNCMSSKACHHGFCPVTCRAVPQLSNDHDNTHPERLTPAIPPDSGGL